MHDLLLLTGFPAAIQSQAQVPQLINFQGRVTVNGAPFNGTGQFKFALINSSGTTSFWSNNGSSSAGSEPSSAVSLSVPKPQNSGLLGDGECYNPLSCGWRSISTSHASVARDLHTAIWDGAEMLVFGGGGATTFLNDTWSYALTKQMFLYQKP